MKSKIKNIIVALLVLCAFSMNAETDLKTPKNEFRSTWLSTAWGIDWPNNKGTTDYAIIVQKRDMTKMLDSLANNNFNAVCFQVRGLCDAMYDSEYEPWSADLTGTRGLNPGWDPLAFVVEECHKRGMECHAWVNPYRFSTDGTTGEGDETGYYEDGWLIVNPKGYRILNPSREDVQNRIVDICKDIVTKYDVDGVVFDDYYYVDAAMAQDATQYSAYTAGGGTLSQADWRRANVHNLMSKLYKMFQEEKPWIRFGQAPPGGTFQDPKRAAEYGIDPCPSGYENCYNSQYIDIMGWLKAGIIDYISPQVYWAIGYSAADYGKMVPWWGTVADKFNRHLFVSQDIASVNSMDGAGTVTLSGEIAKTPTMLAGGSCSNFGEIEEQVMLNRTSSKNGSFGSIFFSATSLHRKTSAVTMTLGHDLKRTLYSMPALPPAMTWKSTSNPGKVTGLAFDATTGVLSWTAMTDVKNSRYTIYAVPNGLKQENFTKEVTYLLDFTYSNSYEIPEEFRSGYYYAVCVYDRFGNEWDAAVHKVSYAETVTAPTLVSPESGKKFDKTFEFKWNAVTGAEKYALDVASDADFINLQKTIQTAATSVSSDEIYGSIAKNETTYWRVRAIVAGKNDGISDTRNFIYEMPILTYPMNGDTEVEPNAAFKWNTTGGNSTVTLEIATDAKFETIVATGESATGNYQLPMCVLKPSTIYYARLLYNGNSSPTVTFTTKYVAGEIPSFKYPLNGGTLYSNSNLEVNQQAGAETVILQVDSSSSFGTTRSQKKMSDYTFSVPASEIKLNKNRNALVDGTTYYARACVEYYNESGVITTTDWSEVISFVYSSKASAIDNVAVATVVKLTGNKVVINADKETSIKVSAVSMLGCEDQLYAGQGSNEEVSLEGLSSGMYIIKVVLDNEVRTIKYVK